MLAMKDIPESTAILLLSCPDQRGIVAEISHFIATYNGNILTSDQHNDYETNTFFMRIQWDISQFTVPAEKIRDAFEPIALKFSMDYQIELADRVPRTVIMVSKYDHCLYDLLLRSREGELRTEIAGILSNHEKCRPIAEYFGIPYFYIPVTKGKKKEAEEEQLKVMADLKADLIVLARYMQILSDEFVKAYPRQIINIHHSFLPAFVGAKPYHQAYARGVKIIGATSHYVTADLDQGPIIEQDVARISHRDNIPDLIQKGRNLEKLVLSRAVRHHLEHKLLVFKNKTVVFS